MKKAIHPEYRPVLFHDMSVDAWFLVGSTIQTHRTHTWTDGVEYPYVALDVSSASNPYYTGKQKVAQTEGRVAAFGKKFGNLAALKR